ncbi:MAG: molybdenum cofactor cytidylyltransferase [Syntrophobacterales bacterium]|nr:molybdenum cofactor cytidylyltransferase [Syntrophobacterales bacterium]
MNRPARVAGVVLAAGAGSRMNRAKQLLPFRGKTILECVVDAALASSLSEVAVILGHKAQSILPLLQGRDLKTVINYGYKDGQSTSLKAGLQALTPDIEAVLFLLGDQPLISPELIDAVLAAYHRSQAPIVIPVFAGVRGNPVLFARQTFPKIAALTGDCGARAIFAEYADQILETPVGDRAIHLDIDTEEDYRNLLRLEKQVSPTSTINSGSDIPQ